MVVPRTCDAKDFSAFLVDDVVVSTDWNGLAIGLIVRGGYVKEK